MQAIYRHEFLREIEWRPKMINASIGEFRIRNVIALDFAAKAEYARSRRKNRVPLGSFSRICRLAEVRDHNIAQGFRQHSAIRAKESVPVPIHPQVEWLVIKQLRRPLDGVNLGNFCGYNKPSDLEQLVGCDIAIVDDLFRFAWIAESGIGVRFLRRDATEFGDERIVFPGKQVVQKAEADGPVVGKTSRFLS